MILIQEALAPNLIFANQFKWAPTILFNGPKIKLAPNNDIDPRGPGLFNLVFVNQFKWAHLQ